MKPSHVWPALLALVLLLLTVQATGWVQSRQVDRLAARLGEQYRYAPSWQAAAFARPDLLPIYGSSEVVRQGQGHVADLLRHQPTGFAPFTVGMVGSNPFIYLQDVAALGPAVRGKKVVISVSPTSFLELWMPSQYYRGYFEPAVASQLIFSPLVSEDVKREAAATFNHYGSTLDSDRLLALAVEGLHAETLQGRLTYYALLPFGMARNAFYSLQDHARALTLLRQRQDELPDLPPPRREPLAWDQLAADAEAAYRQRVGATPFGVDPLIWGRHQKEYEARHNTMTDQVFVASLAQSHAWGQLDNTLRGLRELGAEPMVISPPFKGSYYDYIGISRQARQAYYDHLRAVGARHGVPVVTLEAFDEDPYFGVDMNNHLSPKGWLYYARALDAFYHDEPLTW